MHLVSRRDRIIGEHSIKKNLSRVCCPRLWETENTSKLTQTTHSGTNLFASLEEDRYLCDLDWLDHYFFESDEMMVKRSPRKKKTINKTKSKTKSPNLESRSHIHRRSTGWHGLASRSHNIRRSTRAATSRMNKRLLFFFFFWGKTNTHYVCFKHSPWVTSLQSWQKMRAMLHPTCSPRRKCVEWTWLFWEALHSIWFQPK